MNHLEMFFTGEGDLTVIVDGRFADHLGLDEALGVVAAALFSERKGLPPYLKTYQEWDAWDRHFCRKGLPPSFAGVLSCGGRA